MMDTPRVDATLPVIAGHIYVPNGARALATVARELEREIARLTREKETLLAASKAVVNALEAEAKAKRQCDVAMDNFSNPAGEMARYEKSLIVTVESLHALRAAIAQIEGAPK
jgi:hypothetical protein